MVWTVDFYEEEDGLAPVEEFLQSLPKGHRAKALAIIKILEQEGVGLRFPYSSQVRGRIRELRTQKGKERIRILYFGDSRRWFILLHGIIKRTGKLNDADIQVAESRMHDHERRLERRQSP